MSIYIYLDQLISLHETPECTFPTAQTCKKPLKRVKNSDRPISSRAGDALLEIALEHALAASQPSRRAVTTKSRFVQVTCSGFGADPPVAALEEPRPGDLGGAGEQIAFDGAIALELVTTSSSENFADSRIFSVDPA